MKNVLPNPIVLCLGILLLLSLSKNTVGQEKQSGFWDGWSVQANGGLSIYYGDIENYSFYKVPTRNNEYKFGYGMMLQKKFSPVFSLRGQLYHGYLSGTKRKQKLWFEGDVIETSLSGKLDVFNLILGEEDRLISLYIMAGIGWANWQTELKHLNTNAVIDNNGQDKTGSGLVGRPIEPVIPIGGGFDFRMSPRWTANIELSLRPVNSDKLDAKTGMFEYDFYSYNFVGISYHFSLRKKKQLPEEPLKELAVEDVNTKPLSGNNEDEIVEVPPEDLDKALEEKIISVESRSGLYETPWPGVEFTVQIAASKTVNDPDYFKDKYMLSGDVVVNKAEGWNRFSVGKYIKYWQAKEYRNILATRNEIGGAFVVAYKDGKRIMLSELVSSSTISTDTDLAKEEKRPISKISFSVQVLATRDGSIPARAIRELYEIDMPVYKEFVDGWYQYATGTFSSYSQAAKLRNKLKARGITGAFIIGYKDGKRVQDLQSIMP